MHRRVFLSTGGSAALGLAMGGCASRRAPVTAPTVAVRRRVVNLVPAQCSMGRIIRTTVGLRPYRASGFRLEVERFDDKTVIHNFGHGGAGMSLSWGTSSLAADLAVAHTERRAAVIGCGIVGLTSARQLQRRGFDVTIYSMAVPPNTTSNMSIADFGADSGLILDERRTPEWDEQFRRAAEISYREHQLLAGSRYGVSWINKYEPFNPRPAPTPSTAPQPTVTANPRGPLPRIGRIAIEVFGPGEHPFATQYAREIPTLRFEPSIYLDALMHDVIAFGGRIVVRAFDTPRDLMSLEEPLIVNCTGLGAKALFGDEELIPVKGQSTVLVPQPEVTYAVIGMMPRSDGIIIGATQEPGIWTLDVDEEKQRRAVERLAAVFNAMRAPLVGIPITRLETPTVVPGVETFFEQVLSPPQPSAGV